jgi:5-methyltetrahydropteroyltriglutamate--homocysteine methyltransferase
MSKSTSTLLPTSLVGSYPQPTWLIDRDKLAKQMPPRVRASPLWRIDSDYLVEAQDDATLLAIRDQERAGLDIITDGEVRRESYSNRFATALAGLDLDNPAAIPSRSGQVIQVPRIVGEVRRMYPVQVRDIQFLRANTDRKVKITVPGPFTMSRQAKDEYYQDEEALALAYAAAVNEEIRDLFHAGADVVQVDEPYMEAYPEKARTFGVRVLDRALRGIDGTTAVHICFGYAALVKGRPSAYSFLAELAQSTVHQISIETAQSHLDYSVLRRLGKKTVILGVLDLSTQEIETPDFVASRIRGALTYIEAERLVIAPDCGLKYLRRDVAVGKLEAMVQGASLVRGELRNGKTYPTPEEELMAYEGARS